MKTNEQNQNAISYRLKKQEVETNKKTYDDLLARQKDVLLSVNSEVSPIKITNMAAPPGGPAGPDRERWILTAFAGALITGVGARCSAQGSGANRPAEPLRWPPPGAAPVR